MNNVTVAVGDIVALLVLVHSIAAVVVHSRWLKKYNELHREPMRTIDSITSFLIVYVMLEAMLVDLLVTRLRRRLKK